MPRSNFLAAILLFLVWLSGCASPDVMTSAKNAYQLGNYTKAQKLWRFAAAKGDPKAITNVATRF
jgi:uncharacterized protein YceK